MEKEFKSNEYCQQIIKFKKYLNNEYHSFDEEDVLSRIYYNEKSNKLEFCNVYQNKNGNLVAVDKFYLKDNKVYVSLDEKIENYDEKFFMIPGSAIKGIGSKDQAWAWLMLGERKGETMVEAYIKTMLNTLNNQELAESVKKFLIKKDECFKHYHKFDEKISEKYKDLVKIQKIEEKISDDLVKLQKERNAVDFPQFKRIELKTENDENKRKLDSLEFEMERRF